ncbi:MAG: vitamin K epoxide reductase family protein [Anaerolineales bacterium]|nr:vitamin K epoxide reductase family protein [Anaerolineales bacterium]
MFRRAGILLALGVFPLLRASPVRTETASVKAVLFYNPGCGTCKTLLNEVLPPLIKQYGTSLLVFTVDVTTPAGGELYFTALESLSVPPNLRAVPILFVDDAYLVGVSAIESDFPGWIESKLALGGNRWPSVPGLEDALKAAGFYLAPPSPWERFFSDQPANSLAAAVFAFLILSLIFSIATVFRPAPGSLQSAPAWLLPAILSAGTAIAAYLTYAERMPSQLYCEAIGNCGAVHASRYSRLLGFLSVGEFGLLGYFLTGLAWFFHRMANGGWKAAAAAAMFGLALFAAVFSAYLTFLEPFVIGATCLWCLGSAVAIGLTLPLTALAFRRILGSRASPRTGSASAG